MFDLVEVELEVYLVEEQQFRYRSEELLILYYQFELVLVFGVFVSSE